LIASAIARCVLPEDQRLLGGGLGREVEVLERLVGRERGMADPVARPRRVAREHLGFEQDLEELLVGPALLAGGGGGLLEPLNDPRSLELGQQVGQPLHGACGGLGLRGHAQSSASR
jgi:hypothetical protein